MLLGTKEYQTAILLDVFWVILGLFLGAQMGASSLIWAFKRHPFATPGTCFMYQRTNNDVKFDGFGVRLGRRLLGPNWQLASLGG